MLIAAVVEHVRGVLLEWSIMWVLVGEAMLLREAATTPAGSTASAARELEKHRVPAAFVAAVEATRDRGRELGAQG